MMHWLKWIAAWLLFAAVFTWLWERFWNRVGDPPAPKEKKDGPKDVHP